MEGLDSLRTQLPANLPPLELSPTHSWIVGSSAVVTLVAIAAVYKGTLNPSLGMKIMCLSTSTHFAAQYYGAFSTLHAVDKHLAAVSKLYKKSFPNQEKFPPPDVWGSNHTALLVSEVVILTGLASMLYCGSLPKGACAAMTAAVVSTKVANHSMVLNVRQTALRHLDLYCLQYNKKVKGAEELEAAKQKEAEANKAKLAEEEQKEQRHAAAKKLEEETRQNREKEASRVGQTDLNGSFFDRENTRDSEEESHLDLSDFGDSFF